MNKEGGNQTDLIKEFHDLKDSYNSMKELYEKEISGLRQSYEFLRKSDEIFKTAYMTSPDSININRLSDGLYVSVNEGFTKIFGYTEKEVTGKTSFELNVWFNPDDLKNLLNEIETKGKVHNFETKFLSKKGNIVYGLLSASLADLNGAPHILTILKDITETKKTEAALKQSEERFRSVAQSANDAIITTDSAGLILGWNSGAKNIFGYSESEIMGQPLNLIIPDDSQIMHERGMKRLESVDEKHVIGRTVELIGMTKEHVSFPLELSSSEWETSEGKFFTGIVRDISRRKRTELENKVLFEITQGVTTTSNLDELLKLIHHALSEVVSAENCFIALYDLNSGLFSFPYFVDKYDETPSPISSAKSCTSYVFRTVKPLVLTQKIFDRLVEMGEMELVGSNSPSWIGIPLQTPSRVIGVLVLQNYEKENVYSENDINFLISTGSQIAMAIERKKAEEEINFKNNQLQTLNAEKDKFFSIIAHDLRGPLSAFVAATQIISEEIKSMSVEEIEDITNSMKTSATNIYSLLENLLEWSRLRRGGMDFIPVKLDLNAIVNECINILSESARKKEIKIETYIPEGTEVFADNHMFETIIRNLVYNAIKFTSKGGIVKIAAAKKDDIATEITVSDTGIGIPPELKNKLFQLDEKTSRPGTDGEPSTGLGLLLCKEFIEKHGGEIWVESEQGNGSVFTFTIMQFNNRVNEN